MEGIGAEVSQKVKSAIKAKLVELGVYVDEELPDYIMVMVANKRSKSEMIEDLQLFLGAHTEKFISWLLQVLQKLHEVTVASLDAKRSSTSSSVDKDKEKIIKKKKLPLAEGEPESAKKDRKKKADTTKKDTVGKKAKKGNNLKNKLAKSEAGKIADKKVIDKIEASVKEKKDVVDKPKEQESSSIVKNIPLNLPSTSRLNPKPVLMVSDEDDEDFINIRADAEADLLVSELQEDVRPSPQPQKQPTEGLNGKSTESTSQRLTIKSNISSQERSPILSAQSDAREPAASTQKDVRSHYISEEKTAVQKGLVKSVTTKPLTVKRTPAIPAPELDLLHTRETIQYQEKEYEGRSSEVQRAQPTSKVTAVYHTGSIKSRLGKKPADKQDSPPSSRTKARGVTSIVKVKGRPKVPLAAQASKNLILKAVADAQKSVASSLIRAEPVLKSHGLLTKKNRNEFSKIAVTLPNPRTSSSTQPVRRMLEDNRSAEQLIYRPVLTRGMTDSLQSRPRSMHSDQSAVDGQPSMRNSSSSMRDLPPTSDMSSVLNRPMTNDLQSCDLSLLRDMPLAEDVLFRRNRMSFYDRMNEIDMALFYPLPIPVTPPRDRSPVGSRFSVRELASFNSHRTIQNLPPFLDLHDSSLSLPHLSQNRSQSSQSQPQSQLQRPISQPQADSNQPQQPQSRSQLIQTQPQPDIVASLHEGQSSQTNVCRAGGNTVERMTMTEHVDSPNNVSMATVPMNRLDSEIECQCSNQDVRDLDHTSCAEGNCMFSSMQEESPNLQEKPVSPVMESPVTTRPCSPQFFVTLNGYDPNLTNGAGRVMRGGLSEKTRNFLIPESDEMDIDQEYMDEGIGEEEYKQDVEDMGDADMLDDDLEKEIHSSGPVILRKVAPETTDGADVPMKVKSSERCRFWPACRLGERCEFHHPTIPCKSFPSCKFGDKCLYIHPNCKFDAACTRKDCPFTHAIPRSLVIAPVPAPIRVPVRSSAVQCRFFPKCTNVNCKFYHPKPCRFGKACNKYDCPYMHEREQLPTKDKLKWICPTKA